MQGCNDVHCGSSSVLILKNARVHLIYSGIARNFFCVTCTVRISGSRSLCDVVACSTDEEASKSAQTQKVAGSAYVASQ